MQQARLKSNFVKSLLPGPGEQLTRHSLRPHPAGTAVDSEQRERQTEHRSMFELKNRSEHDPLDGPIRMRTFDTIKSYPQPRIMPNG